MAVRAPTTERFCLNCKLNSDANAGKEFHEIFDEVGQELQLPFLVKTFFHIYLNKEDKQHLCDDCVNRLIELYDVDEHAKEENCNTNHLKNKPKSKRMPEFSNNQESNKYLKNDSRHFRYERENVHKPFIIIQDNTKVTLLKGNSTEYTNFRTFVSTEGENAEEIPKYQSSNDATEDFNQTNKRKVSLDFNISLSSSAINDEKSDELESSENMEFISDNENQNVEMNKQSNANIIVGSKKLEVEEYQIKSNEKTEVLSEIKSETKENIFLDSDQNEFYEENLCEEFIYTGDSDPLLEELQFTEENVALLLNASSSATEFNSIEHIDANEHEEISDDTRSLEEEYIVEEIILSDEYDQVDLNEYLDKVLITKFQDLLLIWEMECKLCLGKYYSFGELLNHACMVEFEKEQQFLCIIKDCEEHAKDLPTLARHLILKHYDKLESTAIYGKCTNCQNTFSNVLDFNKHSCCPNIKQKTDSPNYCKYCDLDFQSLKRYVFHMQFHSKKHRPKICLLCGDLFNNSNDFFEHTQYKHNPKSALACLRCDLFFKNTQVLNDHMDMHEDSKYECALCQKIYTSKVGLNQHMDTFHNKKLHTIQCEYCPRKFRFKVSYYNHIKNHAAQEAKVQTFICSTCGLITKNMEMMKEHIESDNKSPCFSSPVDKKILGFCYSCENCSLYFCTIQHLKDHRLSDSHSDGIFHCGICRESFNTLNHMHNHCKSHKDFQEWQESFPITKYFVCNVGDCREIYTVWKCLYHHKKRSHKIKTKKTNSPTESSQYQFCQKKLPAVHVAKTHNIVLAKFKCSHCKRNYSSQSSLQTHIDKNHTPVECYICLKNFKHRGNFEIHINAVHNSIKRYFCKHCQKGYFHNSQKNRHEKRVHPQL